MLLGGTAAAWPFVARAQQPAMPVIGFVRITTPGDSAPFLAAFKRGLGESGYVQGQNVAIEDRYAFNEVDRLPALMAELVGRRVAVLAATGGTISARAAKAATTTIPIVFQVGTDPVAIGLVSSLGRPGGNLTGVTTLNVGLGPKWLELLHQLLPAATNVAVLVNPTSGPLVQAFLQTIRPVADTFRQRIHVLEASTEPDIEKALPRWVSSEQTRS